MFTFRHGIKGLNLGNYSPINSASILFVSTNSRKYADAICDDNEEVFLFNEFDHDYYAKLTFLTNLKK